MGDHLGSHHHHHHHSSLLHTTEAVQNPFEEPMCPPDNTHSQRGSNNHRQSGSVDVLGVLDSSPFYDCVPRLMNEEEHTTHHLSSQQQHHHRHDDDRRHDFHDHLCNKMHLNDNGNNSNNENLNNNPNDSQNTNNNNNNNDHRRDYHQQDRRDFQQDYNSYPRQEYHTGRDFEVAEKKEKLDDFDFVKASAEFEKHKAEFQKAREEVAKANEGRASYDKTSFFDNISSEAKDRRTGGHMFNRPDRDEQRRADVQTFGQEAVGNMRGFRRGRGGRGRFGRN
eukprot:GDKK01041900.1.p1 GENE.GDKK01041900.1~~GDKK01041900.1.p1  ORF type:complete len:280 (-),score=82.76 GDKK01041900.1:659-1498(-)